MICHKNSSLLWVFLSKGDKKSFLLVKNIFWTNENVFLSPFNKQKQRFGELEFKYLGGFDVANKLKGYRVGLARSFGILNLLKGRVLFTQYYEREDINCKSQ